MRHGIPIFMLAICCCIAADPSTNAAPRGRVIATPKFPASFKVHSKKAGFLDTDFGRAEYQDTIARHGEQKLTVRIFYCPEGAWRAKTPKRMFDDARNNMLAGGGLKAVSEGDTNLDGFPRRSFLFLQEDGVTAEYMDYILIEPRVIVFAYSGPKEGLDEKEIIEFFKSEATIEEK
jgi:hypothetical protein